MPEGDVADHAFLGGRLVLREPRRGHRSGTDAVLLAAATPLEPGQHLIDVGTGAGAAGLAVLSRTAGTTATLVERDPAMVALARHNVEANGFSDRATVVELDIFDKDACRSLVQRRGDVVISNPPFYLAGTVRQTPDAQRAASHVLDRGGHDDWVRRMLDLAVPRGCIGLIHRPEALPAILDATKGRAALGIRSIQPLPAKPAIRILVHGWLNRRTPFTIGPTLVLHNDDGAFTDLARALHRGDPWV